MALNSTTDLNMMGWKNKCNIWIKIWRFVALIAYVSSTVNKIWSNNMHLLISVFVTLLINDCHWFGHEFINIILSVIFKPWRLKPNKWQTKIIFNNFGDLEIFCSLLQGFSNFLSSQFLFSVLLLFNLFWFGLKKQNNYFTEALHL